MIQQNYTIRNIFFQSITGERPLSSLGRDHRSDAFIFKPAEQPAKFGSQNTLIRQAGEEGFERVEHHSLRADGVNGIPQPDKETVEIILPRLLDLAAIDTHVINCKLFTSD